MAGERARARGSRGRAGRCASARSARRSGRRGEVADPAATRARVARGGPAWLEQKQRRCGAMAHVIRVSGIGAGRAARAARGPGRAESEVEPTSRASRASRALARLARRRTRRSEARFPSEGGIPGVCSPARLDGQPRASAPAPRRADSAGVAAAPRTTEADIVALVRGESRVCVRGDVRRSRLDECARDRAAPRACVSRTARR